MDTAAETPPMRKSIIKLRKPFSVGACTKTEDSGDANSRPVPWNVGGRGLCRPPFTYAPVILCKPVFLERKLGEIRDKK
ncbi:unnamed protein product [Camellia sinensis]